MNILYLAWTDMGAGNWHRRCAINRTTKSKARSGVINTDVMHDFSFKRTELPEEELKWADIVHISDTTFDALGLTKTYCPYVVEFRGGFLRMFSKTIWNAQIRTLSRAIGNNYATPLFPIITTPELGKFVPRFHYIPIPFPVFDDAWRPRNPWPEPNSPMKIIHTPSRRDYKDTDFFLEAAKKANLDVTLVENVSPDEAFFAKSGADILLGQMKVGDLGASEREAMTLGAIAVCRLQPIVRAYNPLCPAVSPKNMDDLVSFLNRMKDNPKLCAETKVNSRTWAEFFISYESVGLRQEELYRYIAAGDDPTWYDPFAKLWKEAAEKQFQIKEFIDPQKLRW